MQRIRKVTITAVKITRPLRKTSRLLQEMFLFLFQVCFCFKLNIIFPTICDIQNLLQQKQFHQKTYLQRKKKIMQHKELRYQLVTPSKTGHVLTGQIISWSFITGYDRVLFKVSFNTDSGSAHSPYSALVGQTNHLWNNSAYWAIKEALFLIRWRHKLFRWVDMKEPTNVISSRLKSI